MKMISELFIKQKTWYNFVSFLTEQTLVECDFVLVISLIQAFDLFTLYKKSQKS